MIERLDRVTIGLLVALKGISRLTTVELRQGLQKMPLVIASGKREEMEALRERVAFEGVQTALR